MARIAQLLVLCCSICLAKASHYTYGIIVDAGSSGSRLRMFRWVANAEKIGLQDIRVNSTDEKEFETEPGLSSYWNDIEHAGSSLEGLIQAAKRYIPESKHSSTRLYVKATAGLRLLDASTARLILNSVTASLSYRGSAQSPFKFMSAEIISGEEEGVFAYASVNKILGTLGKVQGVGALDLGGASTQVVFHPTKQIREGKLFFYVDGIQHSVYTHSYMKYGQDQGVIRILQLLVKSRPSDKTIDNPCFNKGYSMTATVVGSTTNPVTFTGSGDAAKCSVLAKQLLHLEFECMMDRCAIAGKHMPALAGQFRAFSAFFYTANGLGLVGWNDETKLSRKQIKDAATTFCAKPWSEVGSKYAVNYCFGGNYIYHILEAYGFAETDATTVTYSRTIGGQPLDWTLGAMLYEANMMPLAKSELCRPHEGALPSGDQYILIVDAGSSGSRLRMFKWSASSSVELLDQVVPSAGDEADFETRPGLSSYAATPEAAGASLKGLVQAAKKYIPVSKQSSTMLYVKATAGMRLLDADTATAIFKSVSSAMAAGGAAQSTFNFMSAETISGEEEGVFSYVSVNSILKTLGTNNAVGALDLGGASTQVTFKPTQQIRDGEFSFYSNGDGTTHRHSVYTHSYIKYGQDQAGLGILGLLVKEHPNHETIDNPCFNKGYSKAATIVGSSKNPVRFVGSGDAAKCSVLVKQLLHTDYECMMDNCAIGGVHMTALAGDFRAFAAFFYAVNGIGLVGWDEEKKLSRKQIHDGAKSFCAKPWSEVEGDFSADFCFAGNFIPHVLEAYGFAETDDKSVTYSRKIAGASLDWTMGAALFHTHLMQMNMHKTPLCIETSQSRSEGSVGLTSGTIVGESRANLFLFMVVAMLLAVDA